jgi:hypothetical protein
MCEDRKTRKPTFMFAAYLHEYEAGDCYLIREGQMDVEIFAGLSHRVQAAATVPKSGDKKKHRENGYGYASVSMGSENR